MTARDVAVIGGGIVGTAAAALLAEAGASVTLYEREALAAAASGRNSGVVQHPFDPVMVPLYRESLELYRRVGDAVGWTVVDQDRPPAGLMLVSHHPPVVRALAADLGGRFPELRVEALEGRPLELLEPALAPGVAACRLDIGFPVPPSAPTYAFASWAERLGVDIRLGREARPAVAGGRCSGVTVGDRLEPYGAVVVAAGPWTPELVDPRGRWRPISRLWGVVVETQLADPPRHVLEEAEMDEALGTGDVAAEAGAARAETEGEPDAPEFSLVTAAGVSTVGSTFLADEPDVPSWVERVVSRGVTFVPRLLDAPISQSRACARPLSFDARPLVGEVPWAEGLFVAAGHGPWGISTGPGSARQVADLVLGRDAALPPELRLARSVR